MKLSRSVYFVFALLALLLAWHLCVGMEQGNDTPQRSGIPPEKARDPRILQVAGKLHF